MGSEMCIRDSLKTFNIENAIKELTSKAPYLENIKIVISSNIKSKEVEADQILFEVMIKNVLENASRFTSSEDSRIEIILMRLVQIQSGYL